MAKILYLDQNAWISLARGAWDKQQYPREHAALTRVAEAVQASELSTPLSFSNIYETSKINDPVRRLNLARTQTIISRGCVFRSRREILRRELVNFISQEFYGETVDFENGWFLSSIWFESAAEYSPELYGHEIPERVLQFIRNNPSEALFSYLTRNDEDVRSRAVRAYSEGSKKLIARIEARRALVAEETMALRRRAYAANLVLDELDFILEIGRCLGLGPVDKGDFQVFRDVIQHWFLRRPVACVAI